MIRLIAAAILLATGSLAAVEYEPELDANIYRHALQAVKQLEAQRKEQKLDPVIQKASSVCYDELGCFDTDATFKHVKQLPEPPETVNTQFLLYTRKNLEPQFLEYKKPETILKSYLDPKKPLKFITHGFGGRNDLTWVWQLKNALLQKYDCNIIVIDWSIGARIPYYIQASVNSELVGAEGAVMYYFIKDKLGIQEKDLHLIGFSLGAQVVGFIGKRMMMMRGTRPARITGLDPASPLFEDYGGEVHLYKDDADFLDVIHTNADLLIYGGVGMGAPIGHVDFYPNGGKRQPGCASTIKGAVMDIFKGDNQIACNHERAVHLYTDSILNPEPCRYVGFRCENYTDFSSGKCMNCKDDCGLMGYNVKGTGIYYLMTKAEKPFCTDMAKVTLHYAEDVKKSYGSLVVTLVGSNGEEENATVTEAGEKLLPGGSKTVVISLSDGMKPLKAVRALYIRYNGWIAKGLMTYELSSVAIEDPQGKHIFKSCEERITLDDNEYKTLSSSC